MDKTAALKNAIDFAKKNPDSKEAVQLRKRLESGMYQTELSRIKSGVFEDEKEKTKVGKVLEGAKAAVGGFAAGVGGVALTGLDWASRKGLFGKKVKAGMEGKPTLQDEFRQEMGGNKYKNVYEVGRFGGEIASLAAPVSGVGRIAEKGTQAALGATKFGSRVNTVKNISKFARAGTEGAAFTAGMSLQEGKNQSLEEYGLQTGLNMVFPGAGMILKKVGENIPGRIINSLIKPLAKDFAYGKNPGRTVADLGIKANNFDDLISQISEKTEEVGALIGNTLKKSRNLANIKLDDVVAPIDEALAAANRSPRVNAALIARLEDTKADLLDNIIAGTGPQDLKKLVGDLTKWTGNASDDKAINMSLKRTYGRIASKMDDVLSKELSEAEYATYKKAQEQYGDLISAKNASIYRDKLLERQDLISFGAKNMGVLGALTTAIATGGTAIPTILAGLGGVVIDKAMATPMFKTRLASILAKLAPKEVETFFQKVPTAKALFRDSEVDGILKKIDETPSKEGGFIDISISSSKDPTLNIGMNVGDKLALTKKQIKAAIEKLGIKIKDYKIIQSGTEPTFIPKLSRPLTKDELYQLSVELKQDAIAHHTGTKGMLAGPNAADWGGEFNPDFYLNQEGETFSDLLKGKGTIPENSPKIIEFFKDWVYRDPEAKMPLIPKEIIEAVAPYKPAKPVRLYRGITGKQGMESSTPTSWTYSKEVAKEHTYGEGKVISRKFNPDEIIVDVGEMPGDLQQKIGFLDEEEVIVHPIKKIAQNEGKINPVAAAGVAAAAAGGIALNQDNTIEYKREEDPVEEKTPTQKLEDSQILDLISKLESSGGTNKKNADKGEILWKYGMTRVAVKELKRLNLIKNININNEKEVRDASLKYFKLMEKRNPGSFVEAYVDGYWGNAKNEEARQKRIKEVEKLLEELNK